MLCCCLCWFRLCAQQHLHVMVSVEVKRMPLSKVLNDISKQGNFYFSYNSTILNGDSLVSLSMKQRTVKQVLDHLFGTNTFQYQVSGQYIIIQTMPPPPSVYWYITGYIQDAVSGEKISNASVYERQHLAGTISNEDGFFRLRLKDRYKYPPTIAISISRIAYADTFVTVSTGRDEQIAVSLLPVSGELSPIVLAARVERSWLARLFISSSQTIQSMNLRNFFAAKPYQFSFLPGFGTHGKLGAQVVNKFSMNVLGGYTAGSNGFEMAGLFNINKKEVKYVQLAGLFNIAGANAKGLQLAGLYNHVQDSVNGWQLAGLNNVVRSELKGIQVGGIFNHTVGQVEGTQIAGVANNADSTVNGLQLSGVVNRSIRALKGAQIAGVSNVAHDSLSGVQIAGVSNLVRGRIKGLQVSGVINYARHMKGTQIGLINISDTLSGYAIGLVTIARKGYHKLAVTTNDILDLNVQYKAGNRKLYSMLCMSANLNANRKAYSLGYGFGNETRLSKKWLVTNELSFHSFYLGNWDRIPELVLYQPAIHRQLGKSISIHTGPTFWMGKPDVFAAGYATITPHNTFLQSGDTQAWVGWQLGLQFL